MVTTKKAKPIFRRLRRWLDRLIPFDFQVEPKPGARIVLADYLPRNLNKEAIPISTSDNILKVVKKVSPYATPSVLILIAGSKIGNNNQHV